MRPPAPGTPSPPRPEVASDFSPDLASVASADAPRGAGPPDLGEGRGDETHLAGLPGVRRPRAYDELEGWEGRGEDSWEAAGRRAWFLQRPKNMRLGGSTVDPGSISRTRTM